MTKAKLKPFRLDDHTIIYVQINDDLDSSEIIQTLETNSTSDLELDESDEELPDTNPVRSSILIETDEDEEVDNPSRNLTKSSR